MSRSSSMTLRPFQLMCAVCSLGGDEPGPCEKRAAEILASVRDNPDMPITLRCNAGDAFGYQDPGAADNTPEGDEFNVMRDIEVLYRINLFPGATLPARILFNRVLDEIEEVSGICGYSGVTSDDWKGCPKAHSGSYEKGRAKGIEAIIPPRSEDEMAREKDASVQAMYQAEAIAVRPHILLCSLCQYGDDIRPPYPPDNLPELIQLILKKPDTLITLAPYADWMMCAPCPFRSPDLNACIINKGSGGLPNQMRDLRVLQKLGLTYGTTLKAVDLYRLIFERISGTFEICRIKHSGPSVWFSGCGIATADSENYAKGRQMLMNELGQ